MTIILSGETQRRLIEEANRRNQDINALAEALILKGLLAGGMNGNYADAPEDQLTPEEMEASLESIRQSLQEIETGQHQDVDTVFAATRKRLGL